jgi:hypothetical protein
MKIPGLNLRRKHPAIEMSELERKLSDAREELKTTLEEKRLFEAELNKLRSAQGAEKVSGTMLVESKRYKEKMEEYYHKLLLYELLVSKYEEPIKEKETKTIPELRELVQPQNEAVKEIAERIRKETDPESHLLEACEKAMRLTDNVHSVPSLGVPFWISIEEMLENSVADYEDKAILLCSILRNLGADASILIAELNDGSTRPLLLVPLDEKVLLIDPNTKHDFYRYFDTRGIVFEEYKYNDNKISRILYEFNDKNYKSYE